MSKVVPKDKTARGFSGPLFAITIVLSLGALFSAFYLVAPRSVWAAQVSASWLKFVFAFVVISAVNCFAEYLFHRLVLHKEAFPFLGGFYQAHHCTHHPLTRISKEKVKDGSGREILVLVNDYPITRPEQKESSIFPWYSLISFGVPMSLLFVLLWWSLPSFPWFFAGLGALAFSLTLYEVAHFIEHLPLTWWLPLIDHPRWGWFWTKAYGFHLYHHAVIECNEGISGFFLFPLADIVFGTFKTPDTLFVTGEGWDPSKFKKPTPVWLIRWLDAWTDKLQKSRRAKLFAKAKLAKASVVN
ncbi:MAG: Channel protein, hemolysin III family [Parcubacteria group bacterium Gr01-1014_20]|nr:MAG: Channel protein, hemolysin III family [Parcubacteria group bacterium Gr01-1014_20]